MFRNRYQCGFLTIFSSSGSKPLEIWDIVTKNGHAKRVTDEELKLMSFELMGANVATTYMEAPKSPCPSLGVKLPFLVLLVKHLKKFFSFEIQVIFGSHIFLQRVKLHFSIDFGRPEPSSTLPCVKLSECDTGG